MGALEHAESRGQVGGTGPGMMTRPDLATNLSVFAQSLGYVDDHGWAHGKRARRELFCLPARALHHARRSRRRRRRLPGRVVNLLALPTTAPA